MCWLYALASLTLYACSSVAPDIDQRIKSIESPIVGYPVGWLDNEQVLLRIGTEESHTTASRRHRQIYRLVSYNYATGQQQDFGRAAESVCYRDGYISYYTTDDKNPDQRIAVYGELGKETRRALKPGERIYFGNGPRASCRPWDGRIEKPAWAGLSADIMKLWPNFGVIDCRTRGATFMSHAINARFHKPDDEVGVELPFSCRDAIGGLRYYSFKGAYFAPQWDNHSPWPEGRDRQIFWLYPDGRVETLTLPYSEAIRYSVIPVASGFVGFSSRGDSTINFGVYFVTPHATVFLYRGEAHGVTSPDGCKVAILIDPDFDVRVSSRKVPRPVQLKVLDFCRA